MILGFRQKVDTKDYRKSNSYMRCFINFCVLKFYEYYKNLQKYDISYKFLCYKNHLEWW